MNDSLDLTDNDIRSLSNFPSLPRLKCLLLSNNRISKIAPNLSQHLPNLTTVVLTNNAITELSDLDGLAGCKSIEILSLMDNPVTKKKYYREWVVWKIPSVRVLDFNKIKKTVMSYNHRLKSIIGLFIHIAPECVLILDSTTLFHLLGKGSGKKIV